MNYVLPVYMRKSDSDYVCSIVVAQSLSYVRLSVTPWIAARCTSLSFTISQSLLKFMSTESVMLSNHLIFSHLLLLLPSIFPSIRLFSSESALCIRWPKYWSLSFSISPFHGYSGYLSLQVNFIIHVFMMLNQHPLFKLDDAL